METKERTPREKALYFQNTLTGLRSAVENAMVVFIMEYGKQSGTDPNIFTINIKDDDKFYLNDALVYGDIILDTSYYNGTINVPIRPIPIIENKFKSREFIDFPIKEQIYLYHRLVNLYAKK